MAINLAHAKNNNYEFDLVQADRHRAAMATHQRSLRHVCANQRRPSFMSCLCRSGLTTGEYLIRSSRINIGRCGNE